MSALFGGGFLLLFLGFFALVIVLIVVGVIQNKKRREALTAFAGARPCLPLSERSQTGVMGSDRRGSNSNAEPVLKRVTATSGASGAASSRRTT